MAGSFSATVDAWVAKTKARQEAVFKESAQRIVEIAQTTDDQGGNLPFDTGFLRASVRASLDGSLPALIDRPKGRKSFPYDPGEVNLVIANATIGDKITVGYGAAYAAYQEYGTSRVAGRRFVALAAQQWPRVVGEVSAELKARVTGG